MKIFDKKLFFISFVTLFVLMCLFLVNSKESYALTDLSVPEITNFTKIDNEANALKAEFKSNNTTTDFSYELVNLTTGKVNIISGSATDYTYQSLEPGEYEIQIKACTNAIDEWSCTDFSEVKSAEVLSDSVNSAVSITSKLSKDVYTYDGKVKTPTVIVTANNKNLTKDSDFKVTYASGRINIGSYKVTVTGIGDYSFTNKLEFVINPPATSITSTSKTKNSITVKYKKVNGVNYQIGYKKSSASSYNLRSTSTTSKKISGLSKGTTYNVKVRTYKKVGDQPYYSAWSSVKSIKTSGTASKSSSSTKKSSSSTKKSSSSTKKSSSSSSSSQKKAVYKWKKSGSGCGDSMTGISKGAPSGACTKGASKKLVYTKSKSNYIRAWRDCMCSKIGPIKYNCHWNGWQASGIIVSKKGSKGISKCNGNNRGKSQYKYTKHSTKYCYNVYKCVKQ